MFRLSDSPSDIRWHRETLSSIWILFLSFFIFLTAYMQLSLVTVHVIWLHCFVYRLGWENVNLYILHFSTLIMARLASNQLINTKKVIKQFLINCYQLQLSHFVTVLIWHLKLKQRFSGQAQSLQRYIKIWPELSTNPWSEWDLK